MYIAQQTAQEIVEEIGGEIHSHINLMDEKGYIIASTDASRIGNLHEGAKRIIKEKLPELYVTEEMENSTTKKGINLPIVVEGEWIGVVGITGEKESVYGYGNIVRRMTEILVGDSMQKDAKRYERRQRYHLLEEWIENTSASYNLDFQKKAKKMGIDVSKSYRVMVLRFAQYAELSDTFAGQRLLEQMEATIRHEADRQNILYLREPSRQICILPWCGCEHMTAVAEKMSSLIENKYKKRLAVGYDGSKRKHLIMKRRVYEAEKAAEQAEASEKNIIGYDEMNMELFLGEISYTTMDNYIRKLFPDSEEETLERDMNLIEAYFLCEGSIGKMAEKLYVHKNTVQYKLQKMAEITGLDIRKPSAASIYDVALRFYKYMR